MGLFTAWKNQEMTFQGEWTESRERVRVCHGGVQSQTTTMHSGCIPSRWKRHG